MQHPRPLLQARQYIGYIKYIGPPPFIKPGSAPATDSREDQDRQSYFIIMFKLGMNSRKYYFVDCIAKDLGFKSHHSIDLCIYTLKRNW